MNDKILDRIIVSFLIFLFVLAVFLVAFGAYNIGSRPPYETPRQKCEDAGGMYFSGNAFSTPNCVFPPEGAQ